LRRSLATAPRLWVPCEGRAPYAFEVYEFGELGTYLPPDLVREVREALVESVSALLPFDSLVSPEPGGHTWGLLVADWLGCGIHILRRDAPPWFTATRADRRTAYYSGNLSFGELTVGERVVVLDDVVSSGGTLSAVVEHLRALGAEVVGAQVILAKGGGADDVARRHGIAVQRLWTKDAP
jgi:adenine phosphoribosyltransferase